MATTRGDDGGSDPGPLAPGFRALTITLVGLITIVAFEGLAVSTVLPAVAADLGARSGYALAFSTMFTAQVIGIVGAAAWIDRAGARPALWWGQCAFGLGSLVAGVAPTLAVLLAGRVLAGLGGGLVVVALYVVIGGVYPASARPRVFAWISAAWVLPSIVGPLIAAWISAAWSWRGVFLLVVPAVAVTLVVLRRRPAGDRADVGAHPPRRGPSGSARRAGDARRLRLGVLTAVGAGLVQWAGTTLVPPRPAPVIGALAGLVLLVLAVPRLLPPGTPRMARGFPSVVLARFALAACFAGAVTFLPLLLVRRLGLSEGAAGATLALSSIGWAFGAWLQGRPRFLGRSTAFIVAGGAFATAGCSVYAAAAATGAGVPLFVVAAILHGLGMGLGTTSTSVRTFEIVPAREHSPASSSLTLSDTLGSALGLSVTGTLFASLAGADVAPVAFAAVWALSALFAVTAVPAGLRSAAPPRDVAQRAST